MLSYFTYLVKIICVLYITEPEEFEATTLTGISTGFRLFRSFGYSCVKQTLGTAEN